MRTTQTLLSGTVLMAVLLSACSDSASPNAGLTASEAQNIAEAVTADEDAMIASSGTNPTSGFQLTPALGAPVLGSPPCVPQISPANPANVDNDMVPDSVRLDFNACAGASGVIDIIDPALQSGTFGLKTVFTDFTVTRMRGPRDRMGTATFNGSRQISGDNSQINQLIVNFRTDLAFPGGLSLSQTANWNGNFTADVAGSIQHDQPLPSGTLNVAGTSAWTDGTDNASLDVTATGLHFNASCTLEPRFDAGTTVVVHTRNAESTTVTIEHTACGQYTVTRS